MKRIIVVLLLLFSLCGCMESRELKERTIIEAVGIDKKDEQYSLIFQQYQPETGQGKEGSAGSGKSKPVQSQGRSISEAIDRVTHYNGNEVFLGNSTYIVLGEETEGEATKFTPPRVKVDIDSVNIKPASASLYYTTNMDTNPTASQFACSYGVVLSLVKMPDADFTAGENGEVYTRHDFAEFTDGDRVEVIGTNSALLTGILAQDAPEGRNKAWGEELVYANAYICFEINGVEHYVMADKTYELSLLDILKIVDETDPSNASVLKMYETWKDPMEAWALDGHLARIKAAYDEANS